MENTASFFSVPQVSIVDKEVLYIGPVHSTPLIGRNLIDADMVRELVLNDYKDAGISIEQISTGAVIITGESARKENAQTVLQKLSDLAGEFVVSTAGPDLEAIIAGKGSGAWQYSVDNSCLAANIDIGGGTSNIVLFQAGEVIAKGCIDIGGRQLCYDNQMNITYISESAKLIADSCNITFKEGQQTSLYELRMICKKMDELLLELLQGCFNKLLLQIQTQGSSIYNPTTAKPTVFFSGGVATGVYNDVADVTTYGDIGLILGEEISKGRIVGEYKVKKGSQTIRATVVGAGNYTTTISGSTIFYSSNIFPLKNIPVLKLTQQEESQLLIDNGSSVAKAMEWFLNQSSQDCMLLSIEGLPNPSYDMVNNLAKALIFAADKSLPSNSPFIISVKNDIAKALGQTIYNLQTHHREVVVIDTVVVENNDYIDMGKPLMDGLVIPVVVKTLIFG